MSKFINDIRVEKEQRYVTCGITSVEDVTDEKNICDALDMFIDVQEKYSAGFIYIFNKPFDEKDLVKCKKFENRFFSGYEHVSWLRHSILIDYAVFDEAQSAIKKKQIKEINSLKKQLEKKEASLVKTETALSKARSKNKTYLKNLSKRKNLKKDITELRLEIQEKEVI